MVTVAGDAFLQHRVDKTVHFLDTVEGKISKVSLDGAEFSASLENIDFVIRYFSVNLVAPLIKAGQEPGKGKLWSLKKPPVLGGEYETNNLAPADIEVHFSIAGQIWEQVSKLPPGSKIREIKIK